jgi:hypothetical protein
MRYVFLILSLFFAGCQNSSPIKEYEISAHEKIADRITAKTIQKIESETGLSFVGIGGGMMDQVRMMAISFDYYGEINMEQARELLIYCVNEYLTAINSSEEIRPHLVHYPFTPKDVEIRIFISKANRKDVSNGELSVASQIDGTTKYYVKQPGAPSIRVDYKETYEESVSILESEPVVNKIRKNTFHM